MYCCVGLTDRRMVQWKQSTDTNEVTENNTNVQNTYNYNINKKKRCSDKIQVLKGVSLRASKLQVFHRALHVYVKCI